MGNKTNAIGKGVSKVETSLEESLEFYVEADDPQIGPTKIYTSPKLPLHYIQQQTEAKPPQSLYPIFCRIEQEQEPALLSLYGWKTERQGCQGGNSVLFWEYYNFYFFDYLKKRSMHGCMFLESQLWHLVEVCCKAFCCFQKHGITIDIDSQSMVVTPEGKLKVCWSHLQTHGSHLKFNRYFASGQAEKFYYSPEEIEAMYYKQNCSRFRHPHQQLDYDRCNAFRLGMLLLQCLILLDPLQLCYNPSLTKINFSAIRNAINTKVVPSYPESFVKLLRGLLKESIWQRPTLTSVLSKHGDCMSEQYELRVCGRSPKDTDNSKQNIRQNMLKKKSEDRSSVKTLKMQK